MKILNEEEHHLLNRRQIEFELEHPETKTPGKDETTKQISELLKVSPDLIKLKAIYTKYGGNSSTVIVNVYKDHKSLQDIEEFRKKKKEKKTTSSKKQ